MIRQRSILQFKSMTPEGRTSFVAATETPCPSGRESEILWMKGCDLTRYRANPVVVDSHDTSRANCVVGRAEVSVIGRELHAEVEWADTHRAREARSLVQGGFVRALSVGFLPDTKSTRQLRDGEVMDDDVEIKGPARVIRQWELYEISVVPVPLDRFALKRGMSNMYVAIDKAYVERRLTELGTQKQTTSDQVFEEWAIGLNMDVVEARELITKGQFYTDFKEDLDKFLGADAPEPEERALPNEYDHGVAFKIRSIAPRGMDALADRLVLEGRTLEDARKEFIKELHKKAPPVGTPEPARGSAPQVTDDMLLRALGG